MLQYACYLHGGNSGLVRILIGLSYQWIDGKEIIVTSRHLQRFWYTTTPTGVISSCHTMVPTSYKVRAQNMCVLNSLMGIKLPFERTIFPGNNTRSSPGSGEIIQAYVLWHCCREMDLIQNDTQYSSQWSYRNIMNSWISNWQRSLA